MKPNEKYTNLRLDFKEDGSINVFDDGDLVLEIPSSALKAATTEDMFKVLSSNLNKSGYYLEGLANVEDQMALFNSFDKSDKNRRALIDNTPVAWTIMVKAKECQLVDSCDDDEAINKTIVNYKRPDHDPLINMGYVRGTRDTESQPMGSSFITNKTAIHLDCPSAKGSNLPDVLLNDILDGEPVFTRFTVGRSFLLVGFKITPGKTPYTKGLVARKQDGEVIYVPTIKNKGELFTVVDVTPVIDAHRSVTDFTTQYYTGLASSKLGSDFMRKAVKILNAQSNKLTGQPISDVISAVRDNPLLYNQNAPICSLTALGGEEVNKYSCCNNQESLLKFAEGMSSLETALQLLVASNTGSIDSALAELLTQGPAVRSRVDSKYGANVQSDGNHSVKYAAAASDLSPNKWKTYSGMLAETEMIRKYIENNALCVTHDEFTAKFHQYIVNYEQAIKELLDSLEATTTKIASKNSEGVDVYLPDDVQLIVGVNPNEFIRGTVTYSGDGDDRRVYFDFKNHIHYKLYTRHEAGNNAVVHWKQEEKYYVYPPILASLTHALVNNNFVDTYLFNKGLTKVDGKAFSNLHDVLTCDNNACQLSINQYNAFAFMLGAAVRESFQYLSSGILTDGFTYIMRSYAAIFKGQSLTTTMAKFIETVRNNRTSVKLCKPGHYQCKQDILNRKSKKDHPVCVIHYPNRAYVVFKPDRIFEYVESLDMFELEDTSIINDKNFLKLPSISSLESVMANSNNRLKFGPSSNLDDFTCLGTSARNVSRNILMQYDEKTNTMSPVIFKISLDDSAKNRKRVTMSYMSYASESVNDMIEHKPDELLFGEDDYKFSDIYDGYILVQNAPQLLKAGDLRHSTTIATPIDCYYSMMPIKKFLFDKSTGTYSLYRQDMSICKQAEYDATHFKNESSNYSQNKLVDVKIVYKAIDGLADNTINITSGDINPFTGLTHNGGELVIAPNTDVTLMVNKSLYKRITNQYLQGDGNKGAVKVEITDIAYGNNKKGKFEFTVTLEAPVINQTYAGLDVYNTSLSLYGFRRKPFLCGTYFNVKGVDRKFDTPFSLGTFTNVNDTSTWKPSDLNLWSNDVFTIEYIVPSYINRANYRTYYPVLGVNDYLASDTEPSRPIVNHTDIQDTYNYRNRFQYYGYNSHANSYLDGATMSIENIIANTNRPVAINAIRDIQIRPSNVLATVTRSKIIDGKDVYIRLNGEFTTYELSEYISDYVQKYKYNTEDILTIPYLPILQENYNSGNGIYMSIQWIGDSYYWKNPRITARPVQGEVVTVSYENLAKMLFEIQKDYNKDIMPIIRNKFKLSDEPTNTDDEPIKDEESGE